MQVPVDAAMAHVVVHIHLMDKLVLIFRIFICLIFRIFISYLGWPSITYIGKVLQLHDSHKMHL